MTAHPDDIAPGEGRKNSIKDSKKRARALRRWFGRPTAAQNRLLERLLAALVVDFEESGEAAIAAVRHNDPVNYLRLIAVMVPKPQMDLSGRRYSDEDVAEALAQARRVTAALNRSLGLCIEGNGTPDETPGLPALPQTE